jgi:hypothetical protein
MPMSSKTHQYFRFDDIFDHKRGSRLVAQQQDEGDIAYISSSAFNNGLDNYINPPENMTVYSKKLTLSNSGSVGFMFYHDYSFVASDHVMVIWPKGTELNKYVAMYLKTIFESIRYRYNFGREITDGRLLNEQLYLPVDEALKPDWRYMEAYVRSLESQVSFTPIHTKAREEIGLDTTQWKEFDLIKLFNMSAGKYYPATEYHDGETALVSASENSNGVMALTDLMPTYSGNCLTIGKVGMSVYYQDRSFCASSDVTVLEPLFEGFNKHIAMFFIGLLSKQKHQWNYGNQIRLNDSQKLKVMLPVVKGEPDYLYMEEYIRSLPYAEYL